MATFYTGSRPVFRGLNSKDAVNTNTGSVGKYSYFAHFIPYGVLSGAPDVAIPRRGTSVYRSGGILPWLASGGQHIAPMANPGMGPRTGAGRKQMYLFQGLASNQVLRGGRIGKVNYAMWAFDGVPSSELLKNVGRVGFVKQKPYIRNGVGDDAMEDIGHTVPATHGAINRWNGVTSAKVL